MNRVLVQDQDCYWYLIPHEQLKKFHDWNDRFYRAIQNLDFSEEDWFSEYRIDGPHSILIKSYEIIQ